MKKQKLDGRKLVLARETLQPLQPDALAGIAGGACGGSWVPFACYSCQPGPGKECKVSL